MEYKQVIAVRQDLKLPKGKLAAQVAHASVDAVLKADKKLVDSWRKLGMKKVVVKVVDEKQIFKLKTMAAEKDIVSAVITDAGKTVVAPGTVTCIAIGPAIEGLVDDITSDLSLM